MVTFVRTITPDEESRLEQLMVSDDTVTSWHARCILLSAQGKITAEIGETLGVSERSARNVVRAFNTLGIDSVPPAQTSGRPRLLANIPTDAIGRVAFSSPRLHGLDTDYWSLERLAEVLGRELGIRLSPDTIGREMRRRGLDWSAAKQSQASPAGESTMGIHKQGSSSEPQSGELQKQTDQIPGNRIYADRLLSADESEAYEAVVKDLRKEFSVQGGIQEMHIQLAAVYFLKLSKAQAAEDWETAERLDGMLGKHMAQLRAEKKKQESQNRYKTGDTPAEWAAEMVEKYRAAEASDEESNGDTEPRTEMSHEEIAALIRESYAKWREERNGS